MKNLNLLNLTSVFLLSLTVSAGAGDARSFGSGQHVLTVGGAKAGYAKSVSGGDIFAPMIDEAAGPGGIAKRHIGPPRFDELTLQLDFDMSDAEVDLIAGMWKNDLKRIDGSITDLDSQMQARSERQFVHALVTETAFPTMGGGEKSAGFITVKLAPERIQRVKPDGKVSVESSKGMQKAWIVSNFLLEIDGLDCKQVTRIDSFSVKRTLPASGIGEVRDYLKEPGKRRSSPRSA